MFDCLGRWIAASSLRHPWLLIAGGLGLAAASIWVVSSRSSFDTDVLNLLPQDSPSVRGLRIFNSDFNRTRELAFVLHAPGNPDALADFTDRFIEEISTEPWVLRVLAGSPLDSEAGIRDLPALGAALALNASDFSSISAALQPATIRKHVASLRERIEGGSPTAPFELQHDPTGVLASALRSLGQSAASSPAFDLASPEGTLRVVPVVTREVPGSMREAEELMHKVDAFIATMQASSPEVSILVTGHAPYMVQIAASMQRDITVTSAVSILSVSLLFWIAFRSLRPLAGMVLILGLTGLVTVASGVLLYAQLNLIALSCCSILAGLGDDFSLLLYGRQHEALRTRASAASAIQSAVQRAGPGIAWIVLTTGLGFLALRFSGSPGFAQMGTLVALGVAVCAILMMALIFLFLPRKLPISPPSDPVGSALFALERAPRCTQFGCAAAVLLGACVLWLAPGKLQFDTSAESLEPRDLPAARALRLMFDGLNQGSAPLMLIVTASDAGQLQERTALLGAALRGQNVEGADSAEAFLLSPSRMRDHASQLNSETLEEARRAFDNAAMEHGLADEPIRHGEQLLDHLGDPKHAWREILSQDSPWWFVIERHFGRVGTTSVTFVQPSPENLDRLDNAIQNLPFEVLVTGWSRTVEELIPWAQRELTIFGSAVVVVILVLLGFAYRDFRLLLLHTISLATAIAATAGTLKALGIQINVLTVLGFPLILAVGVDYGAHIVLAIREGGSIVEGVVKPITVSGLTTACGFGALALAKSPALTFLGTLCGIGVLWCLLTSLFLLYPLARRTRGPASALSLRTCQGIP